MVRSVIGFCKIFTNLELKILWDSLFLKNLMNQYLRIIQDSIVNEFSIYTRCTLEFLRRQYKWSNVLIHEKTGIYGMFTKFGTVLFTCFKKIIDAKTSPHLHDSDNLLNVELILKIHLCFLTNLFYTSIKPTILKKHNKITVPHILILII